MTRTPAAVEPLAAVERAELLHEHLGGVVVALAAHEPDDVRERLGEVACERQAHRREHAAPRAAGDRHARRLERLPEERRRGERGVGGRPSPVAPAVDDERRERRRLADVEARPPAGRRRAARRTRTRRRSRHRRRGGFPRRPPRRRARPGRPARASGRRSRGARGRRARRRPRACRCRPPRCGSGSPGRAATALRTRPAASGSRRGSSASDWLRE